MCFALALLAGGCSKKELTIDGKVTRGAEPLKVSSKGKIEVIFFPYPDVKDNKHKTSYPAMVENDGAFKVANIPPGQYLVTVAQIDPMPVNDLLAGKYSQQNSKIIRDVKEGERIDIDLNAGK
jgi:hypothetical protein